MCGGPKNDIITAMKNTDRSVLMIEDDPSLVRMYQNYFSLKGIDLAIAVDGPSGLEKARELHPDVIMLDFMMPKMNGLQVLSALKADPVTAKIPVMILSNLSSEEEEAAALAKGAVKYIIKSDVELSDLYELVCNLPAGKK